MGIQNMLVITVYLQAQPGMGVRPELHLKQRMGSVCVDLYLPETEGLVDAGSKRCVIRGTRPDGSRLFFTSYSLTEWRSIRIRLGAGNVKSMCEVPGTYECTVTVLNTKSASVNQNNFMDYDMLTILPFTVVVSEAARRTEDA